MEKVKYIRLAKSLVLNIGDKSYSILNTDTRYEQIHNILKTEDHSEILSLLQSNTLKDENLSVKDGIIYFKGQPLPTFFGNHFVDLKKENASLSAAANVWFNLKRRLTFEQAEAVITKMIELNGYAVTEDGMYIVYSSKSAKNITMPSITGVYFFCYGSYCQLSSYFDQKMSFEKIVEEKFGFFTKKMYQLVLNNTFNKTNGTINTEVFKYPVALAGLLSKENVVDLIELNPPLISKYSDSKKLNDFLHLISKTKDQKVNEKKILNIFKNPESGSKYIPDSIGMIESLHKGEKVLDENQFRELSVSALHDYLSVELKKLTQPMYELKIEENFPEVKTMMKALSKQESRIAKGKQKKEVKFKVIIPKTNYDLDNWSTKMTQCIHSYSSRVRDKECVVFAILDAKNPNNMLYNISVFNKKIREFTGKGNRSPDPKDQAMVEKIFRRWKVID
jgi:hypothetical protein